MDVMVSIFKRIMKGGNALIAVVLCVTMVTSFMPTQAVAYASEVVAEGIQTNAPPTEELDSADKVILEEVTDGEQQTIQQGSDDIVLGDPDFQVEGQGGGSFRARLRLKS